MTPDLKTMSVEKLKALAYDLIGQMEYFDGYLKTVNKEISLRSQAQVAKKEELPAEVEKTEIVKKSTK